jgi:adenylate cyclase class 1
VRKYLKSRFNVDFTEPAEKCFIEMLAVMGSVGTIAYNKKSDFDYWACVDKSRINANDFPLFAKKVEQVQKWAEKEAGVEVHIFINDVNNLKLNIFAEDDDEGFGSTIGAVLKDEFFRSSIIIAGKIPFWWAVPKFVTDIEYDKIYNHIPEEVRENKFIDIGNLYKISKEDFLGAALFQLIKAIGNPFKSILKIGILERYLFSDENTLLLSQKVKTSIIRGEITPTILDSYLLMFNEVYSYYEEVLSDKSLLIILRQNLYLKIDPQLSKYIALKDKKNLPYKVVVMFKVIREWGWGMEEIRDLDDFESWDYTRIIQFWNYIKKFMLLSYQKISREMPAMNLQSKISESDFKLLSSKLKANFSIEPDKIENFITFKDTPNEPYLYIEPDTRSGKAAGWRVYKKIRTDSSRNEKEIAIKSEDDLVKLLAWCSINQVYEPTFAAPVGGGE